MQLVFIALFAMSAAFYAAVQAPAMSTQKTVVIAERQAFNFMAYRQACITFAINNPSATGTIADGSLSFPAGFVRDPALSNVISNGQLHVYATSTSALVPVAMKQIFESTKHSPFIGVKSGTSFKSLSLGMTTTPLPTAIPDGAFVAIGK